MIFIPESEKRSAVLPLGQPWRETPEAALQPAGVCCSWTAEFLTFHLELIDARIISTATAENQPLHLLGDTVEVFLRANDGDDYFELHVCPTNLRAFLRWPVGGIAKVRENRAALEVFRANPDVFRSRVTFSVNGWTVKIEVSPALFGLERFYIGQQLAFSVCRYDYAAPGGIPILSTVAPHPVLDFHRPAEWLAARLV